MSEILLQTIVEKLEALQISLLKENNTSKAETTEQILSKEVKLIQTGIGNLSSNITLNSKSINELYNSITALNFRLEKPITERINHTHRLYKGIWISIGLFVISTFLLFGWINCIHTKEQFKANDIKYRFMKVNGNFSLLKLIYQTDSLYNLNNNIFIRQVIDKEQYGSREKLFRIAGEKKKNKALKRIKE